MTISELIDYLPLWADRRFVARCGDERHHVTNLEFRKTYECDAELSDSGRLSSEVSIMLILTASDVLKDNNTTDNGEHYITGSIIEKFIDKIIEDDESLRNPIMHWKTAELSSIHVHIIEGDVSTDGEVHAITIIDPPSIVDLHGYVELIYV